MIFWCYFSITLLSHIINTPFMQRHLLLMICISFSLIATAQNVGVGQSAPKSKLDVNGGVTVGSGYSGTNTAPSNGAIIQGQVGVGTNAPNAAAALDVTSTTQGILYPRMTTAQRNAIASPVVGLVIYNTDCDNLNYYSSTSGWKSTSATGPIASAATNTGTTAGTTFTANWQAAGGATSYTLDVSTSSTFATTISGYSNLNVGTALTYNISGLTCGTTYYYRVRAVQCAGYSDYSNTITATPHGTGKQVFAYTGSNQTFTIPCGVTSINVKIWGAGGGGGYEASGGAGGYVSGTYTVSGTTALTVVVGGGGAINTGANGSTTAAAGAASFGGGGAGLTPGSNTNPSYSSGSGGGMSAILLSGTYLAAAGGGGGGGSFDPGAGYPTGGAGGGGAGTGSGVGGNGYDGGNSAGAYGSGGSTTAGAGGTGSAAAYNGAAGTAGQGGAGKGGYGTYLAVYALGGGGGGGYPFGGGGGGGSNSATNSTAGGTTSSKYIGGGGGGASYTSGAGFSGTSTPATLTSQFSTNLAPNSTDSDYTGTVGQGGDNTPTIGGNGLVVISW